jgi:hypothetical protein
MALRKSRSLPLKEKCRPLFLLVRNEAQRRNDRFRFLGEHLPNHNFKLFAFLFLSFIHPYANTDKTLEEEFLSILKPCDISPRNIDCTEMSLISNNIDKTLEEEFFSILKLCGISPRSFDGESCHNSIIDSALRSNNIRASDMHTTVVIPTNLTSTMCPSSARCPRIEFPISKLMDDPTTCSPLLNPNAIHERRSLDILKIKEDCCNDDGVPENEKQELDVGDCYYATTTNLSSNTHSFRKKMYRCALPMVRVLSPPFARHQRTEEEKRL